jgi:CheY-like chemotaxis protein/signal transduction histidine kinase
MNRKTCATEADQLAECATTQVDPQQTSGALEMPDKRGERLLLLRMMFIPRGGEARRPSYALIANSCHGENLSAAKDNTSRDYKLLTKERSGKAAMPAQKSIIDLPNKQLEFLSSVVACRADYRRAIAVVLLSLMVFMAAIPFARVPLIQLPAFIPVYQSALIINDAITAVLLFAQFTFTRSPALLVLASAYLFTSLIAACHLLTFPGLFSTTGLLGAQPQSTAWLYMFWHGTFPIAAMAYSLLKNSDSGRKRLVQLPTRTAILSAVTAVAGLTCVFTALATAGHTHLPAIMEGNGYSPAFITVVSTVWILSFFALGVLWIQRPHAVLDLWLMVVMCAWIFDIGLSAVFNAGRFDLGFYAGRIYGLMAASYVLVVLLLETAQLHASFLQARAKHAVDLQKANDDLGRAYRGVTEELQRNVEELTTKQRELEASNCELEEKTEALELHNAQIRHQAEELEEAKRLIEAKASQLELSSKYKSEFLANMSHELRTPLNSLLILARDLNLNEDGNLTADQVEETRVIYNGGLELLHLINDILDLSKVEAGKVTITPADVHLRGVAKRLAQQFQPIAQEADLAFDIRVDEDLPSIVHTDVQRLEQILKNLLSNAIKFTEAGSVTLMLHDVTDNGARRLSLAGTDAIAFSVIDTGLGIEKAKFDDIFEAFQQEDGSTHRHYGGTGLGLTIARKFARLLGGEIHVASEKGKGSTFTLILPLAGTDAPTKHSAPLVVSPVFASETKHAAVPLQEHPRAPVKTFIPDDRDLIGPNDKVLLIIEDDPDFGTTLMKIGRKRGYRCLVAGDGKSGLLLAAERPITAILLDLGLPDMDGLRVLDQLKYDLLTRHIPVHIISGVESAGNLPLQKGAIGYLTKPVQQEDLDGTFSQIEAVLQSSLKRVLVVEADKNTQSAIHSLLKNKQVEIVNAGSGGAALTQMKAAHFDCIILDLKLPDMTGFDWLKAVEKEHGPGTPPIIIYTARDLPDEKKQALNRYAGRIVIKDASSSARLLDEVTLFLHSLEATLSTDQQAMIRMQHDPDHVLHRRTVLLVDDDLRNTFALSKLLKKHGMSVIIADNGQMALEKLREEKAIELIIMDIMMPVMDGYQATREIRAKANWAQLPIIALTARAMPEEQERCMEAGANDYLVKPVDIDRLLTLLRVWLLMQERAA